MFAGCASAVPTPTEADTHWARTQWEDTSTESLARGRALYVNKCAGCHSLYVPTRIAHARWRTIVDRMGRRANLRPDEQELILRYLVTSSRENVTAR